jgi:hypothetical protein
MGKCLANLVEGVKTYFLRSITFFRQDTYSEYVICIFFVNIYLQDVNTHTSVPDSTKLFLDNQFTCRTLAVRGGHGATSMLYVLLFHDNSGYVSAPQCYFCRYIACFVHRDLVARV